MRMKNDTQIKFAIIGDGRRKLCTLIEAISNCNDIVIVTQDNKDLSKLDRIEDCYENNLS